MYARYHRDQSACQGGEVGLRWSVGSTRILILERWGLIAS